VWTGPTLIEAYTYRMGAHTTADDPTKYRDEAELEEWRGRDPLLRLQRYLQHTEQWSEAWEQQMLAECTAEIEQAMEEAAAVLPPPPQDMFRLHVCGDDAAAHRARGRAACSLQQQGRAMALRTLVEAINDALRCEMAADDRVILLGEDIGREGGVFRVTEGLQAVYGPQRVVDTPLAESGIAGMAIGMAIAGLRPVAEMQFMAFLYPAFDQIINHLGRMRNRSRGRFTCPLVMRAPCGGGIHPPEHHSESGEAILAHTPGIKVVIPATPYDAKGLLISAIRDPDPVIFLEPERMYRPCARRCPMACTPCPLARHVWCRRHGCHG